MLDSSDFYGTAPAHMLAALELYRTALALHFMSVDVGCRLSR